MPRPVRRPKPPAPTEDQLQRTAVEWLRLVLPRGAIVHHSPNGGWRTKAEAGRFKAMGVVPGHPDLVIYYAGKTFFIEMKRPGESLSSAQTDFKNAIEAQGFPFGIAFGPEDAIAFAKAWGLTR